MNNNETKANQAFENDMKINYICWFATLVASNIDSLYNHFENNHQMSFESMITMSNDSYQLDTNDQALLIKLINKTLKDDYHLEIVSQEKLILQECE